MPSLRWLSPPGILAAALALLSGCAVPSEPTSRHPVTPQAINDLAVHQQGDTAILTFTLPTQSTDQEALPSTPTVEIYRSAASAAATPRPSARNSKRQTVRPTDTIPGGNVNTYKRDNHIEFRDPLDPADLARDPGQQIVFTVRTRVNQRRASGDSNAVTLPLYPAPGPVRDLRATVTEPAIDLTWAAPDETGGRPPIYAYRVYRAESSALRVASGAPAASPTAEAAPLQFMMQVTQLQYRDTTVQLDHEYSYAVRAVAQFGSNILESADAGLAVNAKDVFPPAAPQALQAIVMPAADGTPAYVELVWAISTEPDLAGYNVYRSEQAGAIGTKLTPELLGAPTFRDASVAPGMRYYYQVTAVDRDGNESPASAEAETMVP